MKIILNFLCCFVFVHFAKANVLPHPFHVSKTDIVYSAKENTLQITMHLFIDDLEKAFLKRGIENLRLGTDKESAMSNQFIAEYLRQKFNIKTNTQFVDFQWVGKEITDDFLGLWCYLEVKNVTNLNRVEVISEVMTDIFSDQQNIISIVGPQKKKGYFLLTSSKNYDGIWF